MKALEKKLTGIYVPGYQHAHTKKFDSSSEEMILDVLDTDEDRIMHQYNSNRYSKSRSQSKQHSKNIR